MTGRTHEWIDQRSLALDRMVADKLARNPELLLQVRKVLEKWISERQPDPPRVLLEWRRILDDCPLPEVLEWLRSDTEEARRLRQSSPFCGILSQEERLAVFRKYESRRT